jgi:uncharacterized protein (DUF1800 family)
MVKTVAPAVPFPADPKTLAEMLVLGLDPYTGPVGDNEIKHLLNRALFGFNEENFNSYLYKGSLSGMIEAVVAIPSSPSPPVVNYTNGVDIVEEKAKDGETWINEPWNDKIEYLRLISLKTWWLDNILQSNTLFEKMVVFWHNHIPVEMVGVFHARQGYDYLSTIRKHALGNFKDLLKALTLDPMMLFYLNGTYNEKFAPDENYGRELQELFCIGKGPDSKYTEGDVKAAARVLTGYKTDFQRPSTYFNPTVHDTNDKQFSAFYGNKIIKGRIGYDGQLELDEMLKMIVTHPECSKYICRKLYRFFVYPEISDWTEANIITPLAKIFSDQNYEILPVIKTLLSSNHFFDPLIRMAMIKSPLDYTIGLNKQFGMPFPQHPAAIKQKFQAQTVLYYFLTNFQQDLGDPPNVSGWPAYYQYPNYDKSWITTHTIHQRGVHSDMLIWYGYQMGDQVARIDWVRYTANYIHASDPNALIQDVLTNLFPMPVSDQVKAYLKTILLSGQISDYYWTNAWNEWKQNQNNAMARNTVEIRLKMFYQYILQMDEYQLM